MLLKAHLTSHSRMWSLGWWSHYRDYLGCEDLFCIVLLCIFATSSKYLLLLFGPYHFYPLLSPSLHEMFPWYLFLEEISSLSRCVVFLYFFVLITEEGFLISPCYSCYTREDSTHGHHQMVNTKIRLIIFFAAKGGKALYSQQKHDQKLTVAQIMNSLLSNLDLNWRK